MSRVPKPTTRTGGARRTVTGLYQRPDGTPAAGTVTFTPSARLVNNVDRTVVLPNPVRVVLDQAGQVSVDLLRTDHPDIVPTRTDGVLWVWQVEERIEGEHARYRLHVPAGADPLDLAAAPESLALVGGVRR